MTRKELIKAVAVSTGLTIKDATAAVEATLSTITATVAAGERVSIMGFGTFEKKHREARTGRNPHTNEAVEIAATDVPVFKAGKEFKEKVDCRRAS